MPHTSKAQGRSERAFRSHQERLSKKLALRGVTTMETANRYLSEVYLPAFVPWTGESLDEILCEHYERIVGNDNCVSFEGRILQIPSEGYRLDYVRATIRIHRHPDGSLSLFHGPRKLSDYPFEKPELGKTKKELHAKAPSTGIRQVEALL